MHFSSTALLSALLFTTSTIAAPPPSALSRRLARRSTRLSPGTTFKSKDSSNTSTKYSSSANTSSSVQYSENWSGAAITSPPSGETFNAVSGKITVPTPSIPSGVDATDGEYSASAWVGIDGNTYSTAILQTGVDFTVSTSGVVSYSAWYEWYPDYAYDFDLTISAGDIISMSVNASTSTSGSATIENLTTGKTATKSITSTYALGGVNAEWIVEDFESGSELVAFANFGNVTFTECVAATAESSEGVSSATIMDIENTSNEILTDVTLVSDSSFEVSYSASTSTSGSGTGTTTGSGSTTSSSSSSGFGNGAGTGGMGEGFGNGHGDSVTSGAPPTGFGFKRWVSRWGRLSTSGGL